MKTLESYAAKIFTKESLKKSRSKKNLLSEIKIHKSLDHQNIVQFRHFFEDPENVYALLELCSNQTLNDLVKRRGRLQEIEAKYFLLQIIDGVEYLHTQKKVIHRDLKLGNLFLSEHMEIKIGDFGLACSLNYDDERKLTLCGTPNYIAPEVLMNSKKGYSYEIDVWAIGVILYAMIIGKPPFETKEVKTTYWKIQNTAYQYPEGIPISVEAKHLIDNILTFDPKNRLTLSQIKNHPFITKCRFIPKTLPIECMERVIPPNELQEMEKMHYESSQMSFQKLYFEDRDSEDYSIPETSNDKVHDHINLYRKF